MNFAVQHLSDEAVAAFADGMLGAGARQRAGRHLDECPDCARAVAEQRAAASALRAAPAPVLPAGLLERLRAVPSTTPLKTQPLSLAPDGSAVFPAYSVRSGQLGRPGSPFEAAALPAEDPRPSEFRLPIAAIRRVSHRTQQLALVTAAAALVTVGMAASAAASTSSEGRVPTFAPAGGSSGQPVEPATRRQPAGNPLELVGAVSSSPNR